MFLKDITKINCSNQPVIGIIYVVTDGQFKEVGRLE